MSRSNDCYDAIPYAERIGIPLVVETQEGGGMPAAATTPQSGASVVRVHTVVSSTALLAFESLEIYVLKNLTRASSFAGRPMSSLMSRTETKAPA